MLLGQEFQEPAEDADGHKHVGFRNGLVRVMADALLAAHEQHRNRGDGGERGGVVAGATGNSSTSGTCWTEASLSSAESSFEHCTEEVDCTTCQSNPHKLETFLIIAESSGDGGREEAGAR